MNDSMLPRMKNLRHDHPWVEKYRLPVVHGTGGWAGYHVALDGSEENPTWPNANLVPTEKEAEILASFNEFTIDRQGYRTHYLEQMRNAGPVDFDPGYNTMSFEKRHNGNWAYQRSTFRDGTFPNWMEPVQYPDLVDLLDRIESYSPERWNEWKAEHSITTAL